MNSSAGTFAPPSGDAELPWHEVHQVRAERLLREERANAITHAIGSGLALAAVAGLLWTVSRTGTRAQVVACALYGSSLVAVYLASTLSHAFHQPRLRRWFRMLDQGFIFLLIAGTFTPPAATFLPAGWWWTVPAAMWVIALYGFVAKVGFARKVDAVTPRLHLAQGWLPVLTVKPLLAVAPLGLFLWLAAGGVCYTVGTLFLTRDHRAYFHAVWHVCVIAGSACHMVAIWIYCVAPPA